MHCENVVLFLDSLSTRLFEGILHMILKTQRSQLYQNFHNVLCGVALQNLN